MRIDENTVPTETGAGAMPWSPGPDAGAGVHGMHAMLHPRNIVIVGASDKPRNYALRIWNNLVKYGWAGAMYAVNPTRDEIWGTTCYRSLAALPEPPDHVVVLVPARLVAGVLREAAAAGARSATVVSSGFGESQDEAGHALAAELAQAIAETGLAVTGPNCLGNLSSVERIFTNVDERPVSMIDGPVAIAGQSGAVVMHIRNALDARAVGVRYMVTTGNEAGLSTADCIAYFAAEPGVRVIVAYLEGVRDTLAFRRACQAARDAGKPVLVLKVGVSEGGRAAAMSHTGALAGAVEAFDAVAAQDGVVRVSGLDDLIETTECFVHARLPRGARIAALTPSGGQRALMLDAFAAAGRAFAPLAPALAEKLEAMLGPGSGVGNPLDAGFAAITNPTVYMAALQALVDDPDIDLVVVDSELPRTPNEVRERNFRAVDAMAAQAGKPVLYICPLSLGLSDHGREFRRTLQHVGVLHGTDRAVAAIDALIRYATAERVAEQVAPAPASAAARAALFEVLEGQAGALDEVHSKRLLAAYGIPVSQEAVAHDVDEAVRIARRLGFPLVAKVVSDEILHKSDVGGVVLGLADEAAVAQAFLDIGERVRALPGRPRTNGVLIAQQVRGDIELVIGGSVDPEMGPVVLFGTGGVEIELLKDVALAAAPLDEAGARRLIARTRAGALLAGYRGRPALHVDSVVKALVGVSQLMCDAGGRIASIDVNPFLAGRASGCAVDALVVLGQGQQHAPAAPAVSGR